LTPVFLHSPSIHALTRSCAIRQVIQELRRASKSPAVQMQMPRMRGPESFHTIQGKSNREHSSFAENGRRSRPTKMLTGSIRHWVMRRSSAMSLSIALPRHAFREEPFPSASGGSNISRRRRHVAKL